MTVCQPYFNLSQSGDSSRVYEIFIVDDECVSNYFKAVTFTLSVVVYALIFLLTNYLLVKDYLDKQYGTRLRKLAYLTVWIGSLTSMILHAMFMSGSHSLSRYVISMIPNMTQRAYGTMVHGAWFETVRNIDIKQYNRFRFIFRFLTHLFDVLVVIINVVAPAGMIYYQDQPIIVNRYFITHVSGVMLLSILSCIVSIVVGKELVKACSPKDEMVRSKLVDRFCSRVTTTTQYMKLMIAVQSPFLLLPLWLLIDLKYFSYVYYTLVTIMMMSAYLDTLHAVHVNRDTVIYEVSSNSDNGNSARSSNNNKVNSGSNAQLGRDNVELSVVTLVRNDDSKGPFSFTVKELSTSS